MWYHPPNTLTLSYPILTRKTTDCLGNYSRRKCSLSNDKWTDRGRLPQGRKTRKKGKGAGQEGEGGDRGELDRGMDSRSLLHFNS